MKEMCASPPASIVQRCAKLTSLSQWALNRKDPSIVPEIQSYEKAVGTPHVDGSWAIGSMSKAVNKHGIGSPQTGKHPVRSHQIALHHVRLVLQKHT